MNKSELIIIAKNILSVSKTAVLATTGSDQTPRMRWMSPVFLRNYENYIYAVTSQVFNKTGDIKKNGRVQWMLQTSSLSRIITFDGTMNMVENVSLRAEVLEALGSRLETFWTINKDPSTLIVLETEITSGMLFTPVKGQKELVSFNEES
ncbi:MAG: pyridoxamine 5'-phosphate oxidase family protein [Spirochaetales bacterium]|nr:pyridoxamine 5'-phosphate oxidase family protein [Spirochaetales bacterium]